MLKELRTARKLSVLELKPPHCVACTSWRTCGGRCKINYNPENSIKSWFSFNLKVFMYKIIFNFIKILTNYILIDLSSLSLGPRGQGRIFGRGGIRTHPPLLSSNLCGAKVALKRTNFSRSCQISIKNAPLKLEFDKFGDLQSK